MKVLLFGFMLALPIALFVWARRRKRGPKIDPRTAWDAVKSGAPMTNELAAAIGVFVALNARPARGVVEQVLGDDRWRVKLDDGAIVTATRTSAMWRGRVVPERGERVALQMVPGDVHGLIVGRVVETKP